MNIMHKAIITAVIILLLSLSVVFCKMITYPIGKIDYCYIQISSTGLYWNVFGHVPWHIDILVTKAMSFEEAVKVRDTQCRGLTQ